MRTRILTARAGAGISEKIVIPFLVWAQRWAVMGKNLKRSALVTSAIRDTYQLYRIKELDRFRETGYFIAGVGCFEGLWCKRWGS